MLKPKPCPLCGEHVSPARTWPCHDLRTGTLFRLCGSCVRILCDSKDFIIPKAAPKLERQLKSGRFDRKYRTFVPDL